MNFDRDGIIRVFGDPFIEFVIDSIYAKKYSKYCNYPSIYADQTIDHLQVRQLGSCKYYKIQKDQINDCPFQCSMINIVELGIYIIISYFLRFIYFMNFEFIKVIRVKISQIILIAIIIIITSPLPGISAISYAVDFANKMYTLFDATCTVEG